MSSSEKKEIWVYAEHQNMKLMNVVFELLGEASRLSDDSGHEYKVCAVLIGSDVEHLADELYRFGAETVYLFDEEYLSYYNEDTYSKAFIEAIDIYDPEIILFGATRTGNDLSSRIASETGTGIATDCMNLELTSDSYSNYLKKNADINIADVDLKSSDDLLKQTRPGKEGLMNTMITPYTRPQIATVNPGVMDKIDRIQSHKGEIIRINPEIHNDDTGISLKEIIGKVNSTVSLSEAAIVCAGGRGLGDASGIKLMEEFAAKVGGAMGASRYVVDSGWTDLSHQVGQSGTYVKPKIYFACGISGAIQHLVGMQDSNVIVAINKNPEAPLMKIADFAICGDLFKIVPEIIAVWDDYK